MSDNHQVLTATKAAVLILEAAAADGLPAPESVSVTGCGPIGLIMREPASVYLWAEALGTQVDVHPSHDGTVTHWDTAGEWFDQPFRVTTNRRTDVSVTA